ncbi:MAG: uroporphyrinogen-III synthase [Methylovulum sp.]|nr:uroporphyrinogen-III synthase [Methylovulum sp.]
MNTLLNGAHILVTRPEHQADNLCTLISGQGGVAVRLPTLAIVGVDGEIGNIKTTLSNLDKFQWLVFISANAVNFAVQENGGKIKIPQSVQVAAVGQATAEALVQAGLPVDLVPEQGYSSEALLATPAMQQVSGQAFLIIRGEGGREELATVLRNRGAQVGYLAVYKRTLPVIDCAGVNALLADNLLDVITATSGEAVQNLLLMLDKQHHRKVLALPLVVLSDRIRQLAVESGFKRIMVTKNPSDAAILEAVTMCLTGGVAWQN